MYPNILKPVIKTLQNHNIKPIIVGGFVRDYLLKKSSKDIDIELYNVTSLYDVKNLLKPFGSVNMVGKSFGVLKLKLKNLEIDFSLPRVESKISSGHTGFEITTFKNLNFKTASSRRDFTINAIGYDTLKNIFLDPYNGIDDIKHKRLKVVNSIKFQEDPLRVLRAIQFSARFNLKADKEFISLASSMIEKNMLNELSKQRVFDEIKKLILKSNNIITGVTLARKIKLNLFFTQFNDLTKNEYKKLLYNLKHIDIIKKNRLPITIAIFIKSIKNKEEFLHKITDEKKIIESSLKLTNYKITPNISNYELYTLAQYIDLEMLIDFTIITNFKYKKEYEKLKTKALKLNILNNKLKPLIEGKDLIEFGLKPSKEFSKIISYCYEAQKKELFKDKTKAKNFLKDYIAHLH